MALRAVRLALKQLVPGLDLRGDGVLLAVVAPAIPRRVAAHPRPLVIRNRLGHALLGDLRRAERLLEVRRVSGNPRQRRDHRLMGVAHLDRIRDWPECLIFERAGAAVPEEVRIDRYSLI